MAHGIHGNGGGGKVSSGGGSSSGGSSSSSRSSGGGRRYVSPIPKLNYSTTDKSSARGRGNESYLRQNIADQKANGGSVNDRNFLAETVEASNGERRSNNEYQQQKEKTRFMDEATPGRKLSLQEKRQQEQDSKAERDRANKKYENYVFGQYGNGNIDLADRNTGLLDEDGKIKTVNSMSFNENGKEILVPTVVKKDGQWTQLTDDEARDWYHQTGEYLGKFDSVEEANVYAQKLHEQQDELYGHIKPSVFQRINNGIWNEDDPWAFLQEDQQTNDLVGGWGKQYGGGVTMAAGTGLYGLYKSGDNQARAEYDKIFGQGAYDQAMANVPEAEKNPWLQMSEDVWEAGENLQKSGEESWARGTENMSDTGKFVANVVKTGTDIAADAALNTVAPGLGTMRMYMGAAGGSAYEQSQRENNDPDSRMLAAVKGGLNAYLSNKLVGGLGSVYGESVLGKATKDMLKGASPEVQKVLGVLLNSEGIEEGLEDILNYAADRILGLETGQPLDWNEVKQDALIGYILGVITNGLAGGMNIDSKRRQNIGEESVEYAEKLANGEISGIDEAADIGRESTKDQVVMKAAPEPEASQTNSMDNGAEGSWQNWMRDELFAGGPLTERDIDTVLRSEATRQAFQDVTGIDLESMSEEEARATVAMAAGTTNNGVNPNTAAETTPETNANEMPSGTEPAQEANDTAGEIPNQEQANTNENVAQNEAAGEQQNTGRQQTQQSRPLNEEPPEQRRAKISQYFSNTLTESGRAEGLDPVTYNPTPEAESLTNAAMRLKDDYLGTLDSLMKSPAWDNELVDSAWMIENEFFKQWEKTGDRAALDAWQKLETHKISQTAKGLQAVAKQSRPGAAGVLHAIMNEISDIRQANAEAEKSGNKSAVISEEVLAKAEEKANDIARQMAHLENEIDDSVESGLSREEAQAKVKEDYLDLIDEINVFRHTGFIQDAKTNAQMRKSAEKLNTKFRKMLAGEDMDYIQRFAACDAAGIAEDVHYEGKQDFLKRLNTWQKLAQLTGTGTWLRNGVGNGSFGLVDVVSANNPVTWLTDMLVSKKTGKRASAVEAGILNKNAWSEAAHALHRSMLEIAANIDLATDTDQTKYDMSRTRTYDPDGNALQRTLSRWEQWNGYMLQSSDAWFKGAAEGSVRDALIRANGWDADSLTAEQKSQLDEAAKQVAEYRTFQNNSTAAEAANKLRDGINKLFNKNWKPGQFGVGTALMPYTKVPTNLAVKSFEFSPAGAVNGLREVVKVMRDPKATMAQQNKAVTDFGRGVTGTMLIGALAHLIKKYPFFRDWDAEENLDVKAQNKAEGKYGMQLNLSLIQRAINGEKDTEWRNGDRTVDISSMEPLNQLITTASLIAEPEELDAKTIGNAFYKSTRDSALGMPALQTLANIENTVKYTDTPDDGIATFATTLGSTVGNVAGGMIPGPIKHATTAADPFVRDTSGNNAIERSVNQAKSAVPGLRTTLPVKRDAFGNVMTSGDVGTRIANQYSPFKHSQVNQSDVSRELEKVRKATDEVLVPARNPVKKIKYPDGTLTFSNKDAKDYQALVGKEQELRLKDLFATDLYKNSTPALKAQMIKEVESFAKDTGKTALAEAYDIRFDSDYAGTRELDKPVEYLATTTGFSAAKKAEKWDVVDALMPYIKKMSDKDRDYLRDKNSQLMSYYDYMTPNAHGYKVDSTEDVVNLKEMEKANAAARGVKSASGADTLKAVEDGYRQGKFSDDDVYALMTKQASDGDYDLSKGRVAIFLAAIASGKSIDEAFRIINSADVGGNGKIDEKGLYIKAEREGTNALKKAGVTDAGKDVFDEIMYPNGRGKRNKW